MEDGLKTWSFILVDSVPGWSAWSMYSYCNNKCRKVRSRFCYSPYNVGADCGNAIDDVETEEQQCTDIECSGM